MDVLFYFLKTFLNSKETNKHVYLILQEMTVLSVYVDSSMFLWKQKTGVYYVFAVCLILFR